MVTQPAAELLKEQRRALRWAKQQEGVDERKIDALIVEVTREQDVDRAFSKESGRSLAIGAVAEHRARWNSRGRESSGHELGVLDADAERERADLARVGDALRELVADQIGACVVPGVEVSKGAGVVAGTRPAHLAQVDTVGDPVILERYEQLTVERVPQAELGRDVIVEVRQERLAVAALRRRREPDE